MRPIAQEVLTADLETVRIRRAELHETLVALERALAAPVGARPGLWAAAVHARLGALADDFAAHVEVTEGPGGLHQTILAGDLRLANPVEALTAEHAVIAAQIARLVSAPADSVEAGALREDATRLLGQLVRHRQRGADLVYEAYQTDLGGAE